MMTAPVLKAPFPYFGGKRTVAPLVWDRLGDCPNIIEPFCGSAAFLLARPHDPKVETVNDVNCYVANFWRATQSDPQAVVDYADWPVNEADLHARHRWLVLSDDAKSFRAKMRTEPDYFDAKVAGWWVWGACCWIGSGWCADNELHEKMPLGEGYFGRGLNRQMISEKRPHIGSSHAQNVQGTGVHGDSSRSRGVLGAMSSAHLHEKRPVLCSGDGSGGRGINKQSSAMSSAEWSQKPSLSHTNGTGVLSTDSVINGRPQLADAFSRGRGVHGNDDAGTCAQRRLWLLNWFGGLRDRLRPVRVCCGHWLRVCESESTTTRLGVTGIFLDPPYPTHDVDGKESRDGTLYASDAHDDLDELRDEVLTYCLERGGNPDMRIAVCGYDTDGYAALEGQGWSVVEWKAQGGYANRNENGNENRSRERIWFSPHCVDVEKRERPMFAMFEMQTRE